MLVDLVNGALRVEILLLPGQLARGLVRLLKPNEKGWATPPTPQVQEAREAPRATLKRVRRLGERATSFTTERPDMNLAGIRWQV